MHEELLTRIDERDLLKEVSLINEFNDQDFRTRLDHYLRTCNLDEELKSITNPKKDYYIYYKNGRTVKVKKREYTKPKQRDYYGRIRRVN